MVILTIVGTVLIVFGGALVLIARADAFTKARWGKVRFELPTGLVFALVGAGMLAFPYWISVGRENSATGTTAPPATTQPSVPSTTAPSTTTTSTASAPAGKDVVITSPYDGKSVSGRAGVVLSGTASGLGGDTLWVFDHDLDNLLYYRDSDEPVVVREGRWSFLDKPIGDSGSGDIGTTFTVVVVRASTSCTKVLRGTKANADGDVTFTDLPTGCSEADSVHVVKTAV